MLHLLLTGFYLNRLLEEEKPKIFSSKNLNVLLKELCVTSRAPD